MSLACTAARPLKRCLFTTLSASPLVSRHPNCIHPVQFTTLGCTRSFHWAPTAAASSSPQQRGSSSRRFVRFFSADAAATNSNSNSNSSSSSNSGSSSTTVSFEPHEVLYCACMHACMHECIYSDTPTPRTTFELYMY